jgi:hypothetical protein
MGLAPDAARSAARAADAAGRPDEAYRLLLLFPLAEAGDQPVRSAHRTPVDLLSRRCPGPSPPSQPSTVNHSWRGQSGAARCRNLERVILKRGLPIYPGARIMLNRTRRVGLLLGICALAAVLAPAASQAPDPKKSLAQEQLAIARQALQSLDQMYKNGDPLDEARFAVWERRQVEAVRDAGTSRAEFTAALEGYVGRMRARQQIVEQRNRAARAYFVDVLDAKYRVLEVEMWLNQEKALRAGELPRATPQL